MNQWLISKRIDLLVLLLPVWLCWFVFFLLPDEIIQADTPLWVWVVFVIGIDVSHVWSTLFRTYADKEEFKNHRKLLLLTPPICFVGAFLISTISFEFFWRCLAYVAVYHFIKQQYGFMRIYKAKAKDFQKKIFNDNFVIYLSMLYPVAYWHINLDRKFSWFIENDFVQLTLNSDVVASINLAGNVFYFLVLGGWLVEEMLKKEKLATGKVLWILTTAGNWFIGIVFFNSDLVFTITNVVAHGIPYMALIIFYQTEKNKNSKSLDLIKYGGMIVITVLILALSEEYLWDLLVYRENIKFFSQILSYPDQAFSLGWQHISLALLSVPQTTHYILDGFIWKNNKSNPHLKSVLMG
ncbi:MAG: hypothetical protein HRT61_06785 [Ekhidna sp.]|nr:hypothetical protein [Ekhidna sp.]